MTEAKTFFGTREDMALRMFELRSLFPFGTHNEFEAPIKKRGIKAARQEKFSNVPHFAIKKSCLSDFSQIENNAFRRQQNIQGSAKSVDPRLRESRPLATHCPTF